MVCTPKRQVWKIQLEPKSVAKAISLFDFSVPFQSSGPCLAFPRLHIWVSMKTSSAAEPARKGAAAGNSTRLGFA